MKKTMIIVLLALLHHSCKKKYTCYCNNGYIGFGKTDVKETKRNAQKLCDDWEKNGVFTYQGVTYTDVHCYLERSY